MKRISLIAASLVLASSAQAAFIQCSLPQADVVINAVSASATFTCSPAAGGGAGSFDDNLAGDGFNVTGIRLRTTATFQENDGTPGQSFTVQYGTSNNGGYLSPPTGTASAVANAIGQAVQVFSSTGLFLAVGPVDFLSAFTMTVTGGPGSTPLPFNASASAYYEVVAEQIPPPPSTPVPEPMSLALVGIALAAAGAATRRKA